MIETYKESECSCDTCKSMCKTPCIGTPEEMLAISRAGFSDRLALSSWAAGLILGTHNHVVTIIAPLFDQKKGFCTFYQDGMCELHSLGLKPTEGRYANCKEKNIKTLEELKGTPLLKCIESWDGFL